MLIIRLAIAFFYLQVSLASATTPLKDKVQLFIENVEKARLSVIYPDAIINITLNNQATLNYLPECDEGTIHIKNQRPDSIKRTNYEISCSTPIWKSYLPVTQSITISAIKTIAPINRGQIIDQNNTSIGKVDITGLRGQIFTPKKPPYGLIASRNLPLNTFITDNLTDLPKLIKKGELVLITANSGTIVVKMNGIALENGKKGQQIRVKNISSGRIVYAKVVTGSEVLVNY